LSAETPHFEVTIAWRCCQQLRSAFTATSLAEGRAIATKVLESFPTCPVAKIARLGRTQRAWKKQFLAYFTTSRASNGGTQRSTASSNSTAASPAASATHATTGYG
jgi:hypothetical protein